MTAIEHSLILSLHAFTFSLKHDIGNFYASMEPLLVQKEDIQDAELLLQECSDICTLEANTFLNEENKQLLAKIYQQFSQTTLTLNFWLQKNNVQPLSPQQWRLFAGYFVTFFQWCTEIDFFSLSPVEKKEALQESPLETIYLFTGR